MQRIKLKKMNYASFYCARTERGSRVIFVFLAFVHDFVSNIIYFSAVTGQSVSGLARERCVERRGLNRFGGSNAFRFHMQWG